MDSNEGNYDMIEKAIEFATQAHLGQFRKGTNRPYITHPLEVGEIISSMTEDQEVISAAILHDTIEDCDWVTKKRLAEDFTPRVADLVAAKTEDMTKPWEERKTTTIREIKRGSREVQMIELADKLSNMRDIDRDYLEVGEDLWDRFRMKDKKIIGWYYQSIRDALSDGCVKQASKSAVAAYQEYCYLVDKYWPSQCLESEADLVI